MELTTAILGVVGFLQTVVSGSFLFFESHVCYDDVGCFTKHYPFNYSFVELPDSPSQINARIFLWTKDNPTVAQELKYNDPKTIKGSNFNPSRPTKILIHGFMSSKDSSPVVANLSVAFLQKYDYNIIGVDWSEGAKQFYPKAVANTRVVGAIIAKLVLTLVDKAGLKLRDLHVIGHSLGAHVSGYVGRRLPGIARITGLDPAGPMFTGTHADARLDPTDAVFVDAIHSDAGPISDAGFGTFQPMGHIDFYPNGGTTQPGCPPPVRTTLDQLVMFQFTEAFNSVACSHDRAIWYFIESVGVNGCHFPAFPCPSWQQFKGGNCTSCNSSPCPDMGINAVHTRSSGKHYLSTLPTTPFCKMPTVHR